MYYVNIVYSVICLVGAVMCFKMHGDNIDFLIKSEKKTKKNTAIKITSTFVFLQICTVTV